MEVVVHGTTALVEVLACCFDCIHAAAEEALLYDADVPFTAVNGDVEPPTIEAVLTLHAEAPKQRQDGRACLRIVQVVWVPTDKAWRLFDLSPSINDATQ